MNGHISLEVKNIKKYFGGVKAVDDISLKLYEKEIVAIVGDNGAGKSTFIKVISGVHRKDSGEIYIYGKPVNINEPIDAIRLGIDTVYQDGGTIPYFNAYKNLFLGRPKITSNIFGRIFRIADYRYMRNETINLLKKINIDLKDIESNINDLSGGQRQSLVVGRAVYWGGKILIFDEPTNNLGIKQQESILSLIEKIRHEFNISIIMISHNIEHVFRVVDRIIVLRNGKIVGEKLKGETNPHEIVSLITGLG